MGVSSVELIHAGGSFVLSPNNRIWNFSDATSKSPIDDRCGLCYWIHFWDNSRFLPFSNNKIGAILGAFRFKIRAVEKSKAKSSKAKLSDSWDETGHLQSIINPEIE